MEVSSYILPQVHVISLLWSLPLYEAKAYVNSHIHQFECSNQLKSRYRLKKLCLLLSCFLVLHIFYFAPVIFFSHLCLSQQQSFFSSLESYPYSMVLTESNYLKNNKTIPNHGVIGPFKTIYDHCSQEFV